MQPHFIYLHGFASSPQSTKAQFFAKKINELNLSIDVPDLNGKNFSDMTLSEQLEIVDSLFDQVERTRPIILIGSSMGGLIAALKADSPRVKAIILLAPGFGVGKRWEELADDEGLLAWQQKGYTNVFHYAFNEIRPLRYNFIVDAQQFKTDGFVVNVPTLVFHGKNDETVPFSESVAFYEKNPQVELHLLDSDHQLTQPLASMWQVTEQFLSKHELIGCQN